MSKNPLKVIAGTPDKPLIIGDIKIDCYVLEDETRVLSQGGFLKAIGRSRTPKAGTGGVDNPPAFLAPDNLKPFVSKELSLSTTPIPFKTQAGPISHGYRAEILPQVCEVYLKAKDANALLQSQRHIAERAYALIRGLATVGIIALVDEATGYQRIRAERALATILEQHVAKDLQPWTKTFPYEFYQEIYRLRGWDGPIGHKRPPLIGKLTNDIVYNRIKPGLLAELRRVNPKLPSGRRRNTHHQWFTPDYGHPKLQLHLAGVMAIMRAAANWTSFMRNLQRSYPKKGEQVELPIED